MFFLLCSLGCKANQAENDSLAALLAGRGHVRLPSPRAERAGRAPDTPGAPDTPDTADTGHTPDAVVINTCAVTAEASRKTRAAIRRARRQYPDAILAVHGCLVGLTGLAGLTGPDALSGAESGSGSGEGAAPALALDVDVAGGTLDRAAFALAVERAWQAKNGLPFSEEAPPVSQAAPKAAPAFEILPIPAEQQQRTRTRAFLKIQDGCGGGCAYCVIPALRGPSRSMPFDAVLDAARALSGNCAEIVLTGIEISAYDGCGGGLAALTASLAARCPATRFRLGSLEPGKVDDGFVQALAGVKNLCPHFHLSAQSGCDATLRAMNRQYRAADVTDAAARLRRAFPGCALGCDLIVGYPGESENDFLESLAAVEAAGFAFMHIFPFSARPGAPAASRPGQLTAAVKRERAARAAELAGRLWRQAAAGCAGKTLDVLFETTKDNTALGRAGNYFRVAVAVKPPGAASLRGKVMPVRITGHDGKTLTGELAIDNG